MRDTVVIPAARPREPFAAGVVGDGQEATTEPLWLRYHKLTAGFAAVSQRAPETQDAGTVKHWS